MIKPFYILGIDAEVQNRVGEVAYGNYYALLNFSFLLNILLDLGITNYNTRNIAQHPHLIQKNFGKILSIRITLFVLYAVVSSILAISFGYSFIEFKLLGVLFVNQFLVATIQFARSNFAGLHLFKSDAIISVLDRSLLILFVGALLWGNLTKQPFDIMWFVYAQTAAYGLAAIISVLLLKRYLNGIKLRIKRAFSLALIKQSFPFALLILLMMMYNRMDAVMLERMLDDGDEQAGIYAQGYRFLDAVNMFALLFAGLLLPIFARLLKKGENVTEMVRLAVGLLLSTSAAVAAVGFFYQSELITLRYPDAQLISTITFGALILSFVPVSLTYIYGTLLTANGSLKALNIMAFGGLIFNFVLNVILIQSQYAFGAAIATLCTQVLTAIVQIILTYKMIPIEFSFKKAAANISTIVLIFMTAWIVKNQLSDLNLLFQIGVVVMTAMLAMIVFGQLRLSELKKILTKEN